MELHTPDGKLFVFNAHDFPFIGLGGDLQAVRKAIAANNERMISRGGKWIGHACEEVLAVVLNGGSLAVHHPIVHDHVCPEHVPDALVPQAHAQRGDLRAERPDDLVGQTRFAR